MTEERRKPLILAVDDEQRNLLVIEAFVLPMGYDVDFAHDGEEALRRASERQPDVVLLDVMMPGMDGYAVARALKSSPVTSDIPIVMLTALRGVEDRVRALDAGADDFLTKPVDRVEFCARVRTLVKVKAYHDHMRHHRESLESEVARKTESLREALHKVKAASLDTIHRLARAAEYRDEDAQDHLQRVSHFTAAIARQMRLPDSFSEMLLYAAPMHDIGKIGIPDRILLKPGRLDADERRIMQLHSEIGASILAGSDSELLQMAERIALTHHEKWDGTGYPRGLRELAIPLEGRITAVADVFDALCSARPYKVAFPPETSIAIIRGDAGRHFDPAVVDAFLAILPEIMAIRTWFDEGGGAPPAGTTDGMGRNGTAGYRP